MAHPDELVASASALAGFDDLTVVVEHAGWPRSNEPEEFELWKRGVSALGALGDNVYCKLSGLAMGLTPPWTPSTPGFSVFARSSNHFVYISRFNGKTIVTNKTPVDVTQYIQ